MYEDLIAKLRAGEKCFPGYILSGYFAEPYHLTRDDLKDAADAIEELLAYSKNFEDALKDSVEQCEKLEQQLREEKVANVNLTGWLAEEHAKHLWIPVTERLPNCNGCYLVWRPHFFGGKIGMPSICYFDGSNTWHDSYGVDFTRILHPEDVTHWMPLPEPPESEGE